MADRNVDRSNQIRRDDNIQDLYVNLYDVDSVIKYYFDNVIQPAVMEEDIRVNVPVVYGSPERWKSIQKTGIYRDSKGKIQYPAIVYKRTNVEKYQMVVPNNGRGFSFIYYYDNVEPYSVYENYGIQIVCMKFYINDNLKKYEQIFGDLGSAIVPLSYVIENIQNKNDNFFI